MAVKYIATELLSGYNKNRINTGLPTIRTKTDSKGKDTNDYANRHTSFSSAYAEAKKKLGEGGTFIWNGRPILIQSRLNNSVENTSKPSATPAIKTNTPVLSVKPSVNPVLNTNTKPFNTNNYKETPAAHKNGNGTKIAIGTAATLGISGIGYAGYKFIQKHPEVLKSIADGKTKLLNKSKTISSVDNRINSNIAEKNANPKHNPFKNINKPTTYDEVLADIAAKRPTLPREERVLEAPQVPIKQGALPKSTTKLTTAIKNLEKINKAKEARAYKWATKVGKLPEAVIENSLNPYEGLTLEQMALAKETEGNAVALKNAIAGRQVYNRINSPNPENPNFGYNIWKTINEQRYNAKQASDQLKRQMVSNSKQSVPATTSISKKITKYTPKNNNNLLPSPAETTLRRSKPFVPRTIGRVGNTFNLSAIPFEVLSNYLDERDIRRGLLKELGSEQAVDRYIKENQTRYNKVKRSDEATQRILSNSTDFIAYGGKLNKGWGDVLSSTASGAFTGFGIGAPAGGIGALPAALIGGGVGLIKGLVQNANEKKAQNAVNNTLNEANASQLAFQRRMDNNYMSNYQPVSMNSLYAAGGDLDPKKKPFANVITILPKTNDTIPQYLASVPGPNGESITPPPIPIRSDGRMDFNKVPKYARLYGYDSLIKKYNKANGGEVGSVAIPSMNSLPINANAEMVTNADGSTQGFHETGQNIPVVNNQGERTANVEPGELVIDLPNGEKFALSKRLGFAQIYINLDKQVKDLKDQILKEVDSEKRNTLNRNIEGIKRRMNLLPIQQEKMKSTLGISNGQNKGLGDWLTPRIGNALGAPSASSVGEGFFGKLMNTASNVGSWLTNNKDTIQTTGQYALPVVSNMLTNRDLNKSLDLINNFKLTPINVRSYDTKIDTGAQIDEVNRSAAEANLGTRSISNSQTAAQMKASIAANRVAGINNIRETAANVSRDLRNKNVDLINSNTQLNATRKDALQQYKLENQVGLNNAKILGRNTAVDNVYQMLKEGNIKDSDRTILELLLKQYDNTKVVSRNMSDLIKKITNGKVILDPTE